MNKTLINEMLPRTIYDYFFIKYDSAIHTHKNNVIIEIYQVRVIF